MLEPTDTYVDPMSALYLPPHLDLEPTWVSFPALGIAASLLVAAVIVFRPGPRPLAARCTGSARG
ncbi:hypothetical protein [Rhodococcus sp. SGAir0479]|uniref:hypothetical protein n=1 Tax=Rhodococcus sp. SGAir0479 TaxID=2567884 RepID=UPI0010CD2462|nr:hypothetical protein [Rhodococcus sp. SGAir0479]QCQ91171.1 hypothetical protein E7742_07910 [Rhodococcus sp. SGAir0479]